MKISVPLRKHTVRMALPVIALTLMSAALPTYTGSSRVPFSAALRYFDSIVVEKQFTSKKHKIRLYPNANQQVLFFSASGEEGKIYQFFLFDMDGRLVKQANIKNKQTTVINNLDKGVFLFQVFSDDESIENGKVTVR